MGVRVPIKDRLLDKIEKRDGCWFWTGATRGRDPHLYGCLMTGSRTDGSRRVKSAHRVSYEEFVGPIPQGLEIDHLCNETLCINPDHLEPVTHHENMQMERLSSRARKHRVRDGRERLCKLGRAALDAREM